ncbi:hypothetical protein [Streptomyces sp. NRRL S-350]|uniref:hypothetical protein n=1 Tax=Streptomyces sp. NRRL S-350 TaxID=1463902 RepID=UPI0004C18E40|nr:hypothetical protein [Streptomyces sp. NRRL S-350]
MLTSSPARLAVPLAAAVLLLAGAAPSWALPYDVTAEQCQAAGGTVQGGGYCVGAVGEDEWGADIDGQGIA